MMSDFVTKQANEQHCKEVARAVRIPGFPYFYDRAEVLIRQTRIDGDYRMLPPPITPRANTLFVPLSILAGHLGERLVYITL